MRRFASFLSMICAVMAATASPAAADKRIALVIGMSSYRNVQTLNNPANDARLMAETLRRAGYKLVGDGPQLDLDKAALDRVVQSFGSQARGADYALFYYSGHGIQLRGANYLVPVDANPTSVADVGFQMTDVDLVLRQMEAAGTRVNMVFLDACRNNPFGERGLRAMDSGLAQMQAPRGTVIAYATEPGSVAADGPKGGNSPYTKALAQVIGQQPRLKVLDALNEVGNAVAELTADRQRPWFAASPLRGQVSIGDEPQSGPVAAAAPSQQAAVTPNLPQPAPASGQSAWILPGGNVLHPPPALQPVPAPLASPGQLVIADPLKCSSDLTNNHHDWDPLVVRAACAAEAPASGPYMVSFSDPLKEKYYNCHSFLKALSGSERITNCTDFIQSDLKTVLRKSDQSADTYRADAYQARGWVYYYYEKDYERAIADFSEAIRLSPKRGIPAWRVHVYRGYAYYRKGDIDRAIADFNEAIRLYPNDPSLDHSDVPYFGRGLAYAAKGDGTKAKVDLDMGSKLKSK